MEGHGYAFWNMLRDCASGSNRAGRWPIEILKMGYCIGNSRRVPNSIKILWLLLS